MKLTSTIAVAVLAAFSGTAHALGTTDIVWHQQVASPDSYTLKDSVKAPNGDIILIGEVQLANTKLWVLRIDQSGNTIWSKTFSKPGAPGDFSAKVVRVSPLTNNVYVACDVTGNATPRDIYVLALDSNGTFLLDRTADVFPNDNVEDMEIGTQGNIFVAVDGLSAAQPRVSKLDPSLNTLFNYDFGNPLAVGTQTVKDIEVSPIGDVLITGIIDSGGQADIGLDRIDFLGGVIYQKSIGDPTIGDGDPSVVDASDGNTYLTYVRAYATLTSLGRISKFDAIGNFQWNADVPLLDRVQIAEQPSGNIVFGGTDDDSPFQTKFRCFTPLGSLVWTYDFAQPNIDRNLMEQMAVGADGTVFATATVEPTGNTEADWSVSCLNPNGFGLYQWQFSTGPTNYDIVTGIVPVAANSVIVSGFGGSFGNEDAHAYRLSPVLNLFPTSATTKLGNTTNGSLASLTEDDNSYFEVCKGFVPNQVVAPVNIEFDASIPADYPIGDVSFGTIVKTNSPGLQQDTELWNWSLGTWEASTLTSLGFSEAFTSVLGDPVRHIEVGTRNVRARVRVRKVSFVTVAVWCVDIDQAGWRVRP